MSGSIPPSAAFSAHGRAFIVHLECIQYKGMESSFALKVVEFGHFKIADVIALVNLHDRDRNI